MDMKAKTRAMRAEALVAEYEGSLFSIDVAGVPGEVWEHNLYRATAELRQKVGEDARIETMTERLSRLRVRPRKPRS